MANAHSAIDRLVALTTLNGFQEGGEVKPTVGQRFVQRFPSQHEDTMKAAEQERALTGLIDFITPQSLGELGLMMAVGPVVSKVGKVGKKLIKGYENYTFKYAKTNRVPRNPMEKMEFYKEKVGIGQRGAPEEAMVNVQREMGGSLLSNTIEPMGDIINRAYIWSDKSPGHLGVTREKVDKALRGLKDSYGFSRAYRENLINFAKYENIPIKEYERKVNKALQSYKKAHSELPAYNEVQKLIKEANIAFADTKWDKAIKKLETVRKYMDEGEVSWYKRLAE